jgi:Leucine-rich repeat (LRR) protein
VDFIDIEILKRFPNLTGLIFFRSNIPIVKNIFTVELKMLQFLSFKNNKIKKLEAHVFDELVDLKWINLAANEIAEILHPIFAKNKKLEFIDLSCNKIGSLHPKIFEDLPRLEEVKFLGNPAIDKNYNESNMKMLSEELKPLFDNYLLKYENSLRDLELVSFFHF